jgi:hypothetical protein
MAEPVGTSNANLYEGAVNRLASQAEAVGRLAQNTGGFAAAVAAFESKDANAFRWVLERLELVPYCELICEWVRIKLCVLRCIEICGRDRENAEVPSLQQFAKAVVKLSSDEKLLRRVVDAISCGDGAAYRAVLEELKLVEFCHLICHWVCAIGYRRICELVCRPQATFVIDPVNEIRTAGEVISKVVANEKTFAEISRAAVALNCEILRSTINAAGFGPRCEVICWLICTWRCVWVCRTLCRIPPPILTGVYAVEEAQNFALAARQLAGQPRALGDLVTAVQKRDAEAYQEIIDRFRLVPYCWQVCSWVCAVTCHEFCICVCPPPILYPWFTTVGYFDIYSDIDSTTGKTNKSLPFPMLGSGGGPKFAFFGPLQFGGFCPIDSPVFSGVRMKYRFLYDDGTGPLPIAGTLVSPVLAGSRLKAWPQQDGSGNATAVSSPQFQSVIIAAAPTPPDPTPPAVGSLWYGPSPHYINPDAAGWVEVDPDAIGGGFQTLLGFDSAQVALGGVPPSVVPGTVPIPAASQKNGQDYSIIFQATRVTTLPPGSIPDFSNSLSKIHINNWNEINALTFAEFSTGCCTPIDATLSVKLTVDHEEMDSGAWSLQITSCSPSAPGNIPLTSPPLTLSARGGSGIIVENTSGWDPCSYTATLTTRPGLTTGLVDRSALPNPLTFCICGHGK